jgi:hypothetical protein
MGFLFLNNKNKTKTKNKNPLHNQSKKHGSRLKSVSNNLATRTTSMFKKKSSWKAVRMDDITKAVHNNIAVKTETASEEAREILLANQKKKHEEAHQRTARRVQKRKSRNERKVQKNVVQMEVEKEVHEEVQEAPELLRLKECLKNAGKEKCITLLQRAALADRTLLDRTKLTNLLLKFHVEPEQFFKTICLSKAGPVKQSHIVGWVFGREISP